MSRAQELIRLAEQATGCIHLKVDETCEVGCLAENVVKGGPCPFLESGQRGCSCYEGMIEYE